MKRFCVLSIVFIMMLCVSGCSEFMAGLQVTGENVKDSVIQQIGELEVKRKEVENAIEAAKDELNRLQIAKTSNAVEAELLEDEINSLQTEVEQKRQEMMKLADYIESNEPLTLKDGSVVSVEQLEEYANELIPEFKVLESTLNIKLQTLEIYQDNTTVAQTRLAEGKSVVAELVSQVAIIDAQLEALRVFEAKPELLVEGGTFNDAISEAKRLMDETQMMLQKEIEIRKQTDQLTDSLNEKIGEVLQDNTDSDQSSSIVGTLRSLVGSTGE
ncbi:hypothetical protein KFU94_04900 [Chloroflexi bacterium TSY]|nr:hypothetical protein [Chloroflexi bacterium TSY]